MMDGLGFYPDADLEYHPRTKEPRSQTEEHACEPPDPAQLDRSESVLEELHREIGVMGGLVAHSCDELPIQLSLLFCDLECVDRRGHEFEVMQRYEAFLYRFEFLCVSSGTPPINVLKFHLAPKDVVAVLVVRHDVPLLWYPYPECTFLKY